LPGAELKASPSLSILLAKQKHRLAPKSGPKKRKIQQQQMVMLVMLILRRSRAWIAVLGGSLRASCGIPA
jgi:hypothetical protein